MTDIKLNKADNVNPGIVRKLKNYSFHCLAAKPGNTVYNSKIQKTIQTLKSRKTEKTLFDISTTLIVKIMKFCNWLGFTTSKKMLFYWFLMNKYEKCTCQKTLFVASY